jgi:hypothetical protein
VDLRRVVDDLVVALTEEVGEHDFGDRPHADDRGAHTSADDRGFGQWGVPHPLGAVLGPELLGDAEVAAHLPDVFADQEHLGEPFHTEIEGVVQCLGEARLARLLRPGREGRVDSGVAHQLVTSQFT